MADALEHGSWLNTASDVQVAAFDDSAQAGLDPECKESVEPIPSDKPLHALFRTRNSAGRASEAAGDSAWAR